MITTDHRLYSDVDTLCYCCKTNAVTFKQQKIHPKILRHIFCSDVTNFTDNKTVVFFSVKFSGL